MPFYVFADTALAALFAYADAQLESGGLPLTASHRERLLHAFEDSNFWGEFVRKEKGNSAHRDALRAFFGQVPASRVATRTAEGTAGALALAPTAALVRVDLWLFLCLSALMTEIRSRMCPPQRFTVALNATTRRNDVTIVEVCALLEHTTIVHETPAPWFAMVALRCDAALDAAALEILVSDATDSLRPADCMLGEDSTSEWWALPAAAAFAAASKTYDDAAKRSRAIGSLPIW